MNQIKSNFSDSKQTVSPCWAKREVLKHWKGLSGCIGTHCLKSVRLPMLVPSCTTSCALEPLYWTTLTLDSLAANWKEKHLHGDPVFWFGCACVLSLCQYFCVPPTPANYSSGRGESPGRQCLPFTFSIFGHFLFSPRTLGH